MQMDSRILSSIKNKLKKYLKDREILDIILFGSAVKGKALSRDIDIAIISDKKEKIEIPDCHISMLNPKDFFLNPPSVVHTLLREGYSLKNNKYLAEIYKFSNKVMFVYGLKGLKESIKVKIVNVLRGKNGNRGMVKENNGELLANQV